MARRRPPHDVEPGEPLPGTRREILERWPEGVHVRGTAHEPQPDLEATGYPEVEVRADRLELKHAPFLASTLAMVLVSLLFFFAPVFNGLVGGAVGGFFARSLRRALLGAAVAAVVVPGVFALLYNLFDEPDLLRLFYGLGFWGYSVLHAVSLFAGAAAGAAATPSVRGRRRAARSP